MTRLHLRNQALGHMSLPGQPGLRQPRSLRARAIRQYAFALASRY